MKYNPGQYTAASLHLLSNIMSVTVLGSAGCANTGVP